MLNKGWTSSFLVLFLTMVFLPNIHASALEIKEVTIEEIQQALQANEITSVELVQIYLDRIELYDKSGPNINSIMTINPDVIDIATEMDQQSDHDKQGPLHGIPVILKDNIETADKMPTTAGAIALANNFAEEESSVAKQLRENGAIILGKTNMSEWASFMSKEAPNGYSAIGGQVLNPYGPDTFALGSVGGSSSGSAAGVAANFAVVAIGTETSGSIVGPASANSIVGIKPTVGLVSRAGIIPVSNSQDSVGPMTRTVTDAAITLGTLTGVDEKDPVTKTSIGNSLKDYTKYLKKDGLNGARIGVDTNFISDEGTEKRAIIDKAIKDMKEQGAIIEQVTIPQPSFRSIVVWHEFKHGINDYLSNTPSEVPVDSLETLINFNKQNPDVRMKFGQDRLLLANSMSDNHHDPTYLKHREIDLEMSRKKIDKVIAKHHLDALLFQDSLGAIITGKAGYPSITVPAGYTNAGMPVSVTFSATAFSEAKLIELAYSYENATKYRVPPGF